MASGQKTLSEAYPSRYLLGLGVSKELLPERLIVVDELPRSSGAKIAKGHLREDIRARMEANHECS